MKWFQRNGRIYVNMKVLVRNQYAHTPLGHSIFRSGVKDNDWDPVKSGSEEETKQLQTVRVLLEHKSDANAEDLLPHCHTAAVSKLLLAAKAKVDGDGGGSYRPLMVAVAKGRVDVVRVLLQYRANTQLHSSWSDRDTNVLDVALSKPDADVRKCGDVVRESSVRRRQMRIWRPCRSV